MNELLKNFLSISFMQILTIVTVLIIFKEKILNSFSLLLLYVFQRYRRYKRPNRIILIRHGTSEANLNTDLYKTKADNKIGLAKEGKEEAKEAGKRLKALLKDESIRFYVSPYKRTRQTYQSIIEQLKDNKHLTTYDNRVREQEYGNLHLDFDKQFEEMKEIGEFYYRFQNGENGADVFNRACLFMDHIFLEMNKIDNARNDNIVIVTHDIFIRVFMLNFLNLDVSLLNTIRHPKQCEFWVIEKSESGSFILQTDIYNSEDKFTQAKLTYNRSKSSSALGGKIANKINNYKLERKISCDVEDSDDLAEQASDEAVYDEL